MRAHDTEVGRRVTRPEVSDALLGDVLERVIRARQPISRREIAQAMELPPSTISKAVSALKEQGYLTEQERERSGSRGRPLIPLRVSDSYRLIGIYVADTEQPTPGLPDNRSISWLVGVLLRLDGTVEGPPASHGFTFQQLNQPDRADAVAQAIKKVADELRGKLQGDEVVVGLGVAMGGHIRDGTVISSYNIGWRQEGPIPLQQRLQELLQGVVVVVDNDADALAAHTRWFWQKRGVEELPDLPDTFFTVLITPSGIGSGLYLRGERYHGRSGLVGEVGHFKIDQSENARQCRCNKHGCLEAYSSPNTLLEQVRERGFEDKTLDAVAVSTNTTVVEIFEAGGAALGLVLSFVINLVDPEALIIFAPRELVGAAEGTAGSRYWAKLVEVAHEASFSSGDEIPIRPVALPDNPEIFLAEAAAAPALDRLIARLRGDKGGRPG
jgi:predicted NBD/HSP70 family sugar kinase/DNA-binding transcriptional ArsR family regulator